MNDCCNGITYAFGYLQKKRENTRSQNNSRKTRQERLGKNYENNI